MNAEPWFTWSGFILMNIGLFAAYYAGQLVERDRQHERNTRRQAHRNRKTTK